MSVPRATKPEPVTKSDKDANCGRCNRPKHIGGCKGIPKARHSKSWKATR